MNENIKVDCHVAKRTTEVGAHYLCIEEVAMRLDVTPRTIKSWQRRKLLPYFKIGRTVRFRWSDVESYLDRNSRR